jgi:AbrB family looped-hinge helix DNA binding protein
MQFIVTVDTRGRITIPIELRRKLGWMGRMKVIISEVNGSLLIQSADPKAT